MSFGRPDRSPVARTVSAHSRSVYVAAIHSRGFRNLEGRFPLSSPLSVILGANNTGKSNLVDACRALFTPELSPRARHWIGVDDFAHDGTGQRTCDELELEAEFADLEQAEQGRMVTCLSPKLGAGTARLRLRARVGATGKVVTEWLGGDSEHPDVERWAREAVTFTYLHPLRDAAADLRPGRDNRLAHLLDALAPRGHADRATVEAIVAAANDALAKVDAINTAKERIHDRFTAMTGAGALSQHSALAFADPEYARIVATLRSLAGQAHPLELGENGLGYNNLLYMAVLLSALAQAPDDGSLRMLLVEEPEAHLHPQLQDLLMRYLESQSSPATQVVMTSHSPNFAAAAQVERVTVLTRPNREAPVAGRRPADFGLSARELAHLRRFLDVTKSALLFARGVILVEGVAEQLLLPAIADQLDRSLATNGVTVVNIGGVAFDPFVALFGPDRLPYPCAVVSDADPPTPAASHDVEATVDDTENEVEVIDGPDGFDDDFDDYFDDERGDGSDAENPDAGDEVDLAMSSRAARLTARATGAGPNVLVRLAPHTLEWDLVIAGNWEILLRALAPLRPRVTRRLRSTLANEPDTVRAAALLEAIKKIKGEFAQSLVDVLTGTGVDTSTDSSNATALPQLSVPDYLLDAINWVTAPGTPSILREAAADGRAASLASVR